MTAEPPIHCKACAVLCLTLMALGAGVGTWKILEAVRDMGAETICLQASVKNVELDGCKR